MRHTPANLCRLCGHVLNEVRRLADDTLSHEKCLNARPMPEGRQCCSAIRSDQLSMTNFEQKKNDDPLDVHLAIRLEILAGIRGNIGSPTAGLGSGPRTSADLGVMRQTGRLAVVSGGKPTCQY